MDSLSGWEAQYRGFRLENSQDHRNVLLMEFWSAWPQAGWSISLAKILVVEKHSIFRNCTALHIRAVKLDLF